MGGGGAFPSLDWTVFIHEIAAPLPGCLSTEQEEEDDTHTHIRHAHTHTHSTHTLTHTHTHTHIFETDREKHTHIRDILKSAANVLLMFC